MSNQNTNRTVYRSRPIKRSRRTAVELDRIRRAIYETLSGFHPQTVRQVFYQLVWQAVIEKTEQEYKNTVIRLLTKMRLSRDVPFAWVADNTRWMRKPWSFGSLAEALESTARTYRRDLWEEQEVYVEIWTEKDALAGVLLEETRRWDVPLMVSRGFSSISYLYEAAETITMNDKPAYLYY